MAAAAGVVALPVVAEPAQAGWQDDVSEWTDTLGEAFETALPVFGLEESGAAVGFDVVLDVVGPLLGVTESDAGPSLEDVYDELGDVQNELAQVSSQIEDLQESVLTDEQATLAGTCTVTASNLTTLLTAVQQAQTEYAEVVTDAASAGDPKGVAEMKGEVASFVETVAGSGSGDDVRGWALASALTQANNYLITDNAPGVIESCGDAAYKDWQDDLSAASSNPSSGWVDDGNYYDQVNTLVSYWQTVQAQAVVLIQQAALMKATTSYTKLVGPLTPTEAGTICSVAQASQAVGSAPASSLCATTLDLTESFHDDLVIQWKQAGVQYTDDDVVLAMGSEMTGLSGQGETTSMLWVRDPSQFAGSTGPWTAPDNGYPATTTYDDITGWAPAGEQQWTDLANAYQASHFAAGPDTVASRQGISTQVGGGGQTLNEFQVASQVAGTTVSPYAPIDVLGAMNSSVDSDGTPTFSNAKSLVWIPQATATQNLPYAGPSSVPGLQFPSSEYLPTGNVAYGPHFDGLGFTVQCMVAPSDGVVCSDTVASWWVARQKTIYEALNYDEWSLSGDYDGFGTAFVEPVWGPAGTLAVAGTNDGCTNQSGGCALPVIPLDPGSGGIPAWIAPFTDSNGQTWTPPATEATLWPVAAIPTGDGCTSVWGVPSRCGAAFTAWVAKNIPDPSAGLPQVETPPVVTPGAGDEVTCAAPTWKKTSDGAAPEIAYGDVTWTAAFAGSTPHSTVTTSAVSAPVSIGSQIMAGLTEPVAVGTSASLACSVDASFAGSPSSVTTSATAVVATLTPNGWVIAPTVAGAIVEDPASVSLALGASAVFTAQAAVPASTGSAMRSMAAGGVVAARWEKREAGSAEWFSVLGAEDTDVTVRASSRAGVPRVLRTDVATSSFSLSDVDQSDHEDQYRVVFALADGSVVSEGATVTVATGAVALASTGVESAGLWAGAASITLLLGGALVVMTRRPRAVSS